MYSDGWKKAAEMSELGVKVSRKLAASNDELLKVMKEGNIYLKALIVAKECLNEVRECKDVQMAYKADKAVTEIFKIMDEVKGE